MPEGKPAGVRCVQLTVDERCLLFGRPERPAVCASLRPSEEMCGESKSEAYARLTFLERATSSSSSARISQDLSESSGSGLIAPPVV